MPELFAGAPRGIIWSIGGLIAAVAELVQSGFAACTLRGEVSAFSHDSRRRWRGARRILASRPIRAWSGRRGAAGPGEVVRRRGHLLDLLAQRLRGAAPPSTRAAPSRRDAMLSDAGGHPVSGVATVARGDRLVAVVSHGLADVVVESLVASRTAR